MHDGPRNALPAEIATKRLLLRAPMQRDIEAMVPLADNPRIASVLARLPHPYTRTDAVAFIEDFSRRNEERPYAITLEGAYIGVIGFTFRPEEAPELGYWLGEPFWGRGYAGEAVAGLLDAADASGQFPVMRARALSENLASRRVLEKAGFRTDGEQPSRFEKFAGRMTTLFVREQEA